MIKYEFGIQSSSYVMSFSQSRILCQRHHNDVLMTGNVLIRQTDFGKENSSLPPVRENVSWNWIRQCQFTGINPLTLPEGVSDHYTTDPHPGRQPVTQFYCGINRHTQTPSHTPSIAFRHLPPNSARFGYATEGALFISAQLSTDAVSALQKVRVLIRLWKQPSAQARTWTWDASTPGKEKSSVSIQTILVLFELA